ncbi:MAG: hypothetical protein KY469_04640 [Actinobacteria bacterium]|nr:hypothetical protein [Actinomycetota bacterium]
MGPNLFDELALMREREMRQASARAQHEAVARAAHRSRSSRLARRARVAAGQRLVRFGERLAGAP